MVDPGGVKSIHLDPLPNVSGRLRRQPQHATVEEDPTSNAGWQPKVGARSKSESISLVCDDGGQQDAFKAVLPLCGRGGPSMPLQPLGRSGGGGGSGLPAPTGSTSCQGGGGCGGGRRTNNVPWRSRARYCSDMNINPTNSVSTLGGGGGGVGGMGSMAAGSLSPETRAGDRGGTGISRIRERLLEIAAEYERLQAENDYTKAEISRMRRMDRSRQRNSVETVSPSYNKESVTRSRRGSLDELPKDNNMTTPSDVGCVDQLKAVTFGQALEMESPVRRMASDGSTGTVHIDPALVAESPNLFGLKPGGRVCAMRSAPTEKSMGSVTDDARSENETISPKRLQLHSASHSVAHSVNASHTCLGSASMASKSQPFDAHSSFPTYFNPQYELCGQRFSTSDARFHPSQSLGTHSFGSPSIISPVGFFRVTWDLISVVLMLIELWLIPFEMCFLHHEAEPTSFRLLLLFITAFFVVDIFLNFHTGFITKKGIEMDRLEAAQHYFVTWFCMDLLATIPFDHLLEGSELVTLVRIVKVPRFVKTFRHLRLMRMVRLVRMSQEVDAQDWGELYASAKNIFRYSIATLALGLVAHFHGCVWGIMQPDFEPSRDTAEALRKYYEGFWWAYSSFTLGVTHAATTPALWTLDLVVSTEKIVLICALGIYGVTQAMVYREDEARTTRMRGDTLAYLKQHFVTPQTQLQVLKILKETRVEWRVHRHFMEFAAEVPVELRRKIAEEMWASQLTSLGLLARIAEWNKAFLVELSLLVREEMLASGTVLCSEGDASIGAYKIIKGELGVVSTLSCKPIPNFTAGQWLGEKALVNAELRRSATVWAVDFTTLMAVPADDFHQLLSHFEFSERFRELCEANLWAGLCGRCGAFGRHFTNECPKMDHLLRTTRWRKLRFSDKVGDESDTVGMRRRSEESSHTMTKKLGEFLRWKRLARLTPVLAELDVHTIEDLQGLRVSQLGEEVARITGHELDEVEKQALSPQTFEEFDHKLAEAGRHMLRTALCRSHHLMFLSHYKVEAGTEAALMREELERIMSEDPTSLGRHFDVPIFLDSEDLTDLTVLQERVFHSHNIVLLLTKGIFTRPWVLVEIVTATRWSVPVLPVLVDKATKEKFEFPNEAFYKKLLDGDFLSSEDLVVLEEAGVQLQDVEQAIRQTLKRIAVPYSPHKASNIRRSELERIMGEVTLKGGDVRRPAEDSGHSIAVPGTLLPSSTEQLELR